MSNTDDVIARHRRACEGFARVAGAADGRWDAPSPCEGWDGRSVVEHLIGFHDALVLQPLGVQVSRPDDPAARWASTMDAVMEAISRPGALDEVVDVPGMGEAPLGRVLDTLTTDVLVHSWDLARAVGNDVTLDDDLCTRAYERAVASEEAIRSSGMFGPAVPVPEDADIQSRLLGILGRDPEWGAGT